MSESVFVSNPQLQMASDFLQFTNCNVFLTGKAGTGKTTFLRRLKESTPKRMIVVAPTGVAAINAGGVTIHSMFQMPFGPIIPGQTADKTQSTRRFNNEKIDVLKSIDLLVIDEISMVRSDLLDGIDEVLRQYRNRNKPFGGVQLLMIGDLQQLAPVVKDDEWQLLKPYFDTPFFFSSKALKQTEMVSIELKHIYRQTDSRFIEILNKIRDGQPDDSTLKALNERFIPGFVDKLSEGYIILTTHNQQARQINDRKLLALQGRQRIFEAVVEGDFPEYTFPTERELHLKIGAQVMFVKNDTSRQKQFYNGKIGVVEKIEDEFIAVRCEGESETIRVEKAEWQNVKYAIDDVSKEIKESVIGKFVQYPLKLAWAITIHKSQGLTFEKAIIDASASFAHGQVYVALSRCKTLEGMVLSSPIGLQSLRPDQTVKGFINQVEANQPGKEQFLRLKQEYQQSLLFELFDLGLLRYRLSYCQKIAYDNSTILYGTLKDEIPHLQHVVLNELVPVADKFKDQIKLYVVDNIDVVDNAALQQRIVKAVSWFAEQLLTKIECAVNELVVVTDNKAVRKTMNDALIRFREELAVKLACFEACKTGFETSVYLTAKAKASITKQAIKKTTSSTSDDDREVQSLTVQHPELYNRLKKWRNQEAARLNHPVYLVISTATMTELSNQLPVYLSDLKNIKGLGKTKYAQYGAALLQIVLEYRQEQNLPVPSLLESMTEKPEAEPKRQPKKTSAEPKAPKVNTRQVTFDFYQAGKTIDEIAAERGLSISTIEGHLAVCVQEGLLPLSHFVTDDKITAIKKQISLIENPSLTVIKEALGDEYSYGEIRFVLAEQKKLVMKLL